MKVINPFHQTCFQIQNGASYLIQTSVSFLNDCYTRAWLMLDCWRRYRCRYLGESDNDVHLYIYLIRFPQIWFRWTATKIGTGYFTVKKESSVLCGRQTIKEKVSLHDLKHIPGISVLLIFVISCYLSTSICTNTKTPEKFFLARIESLRMEDVVHCTDCEAHWGSVIEILGYINKTDSTWQLMSSDIFWYNKPVNTAPNWRLSPHFLLFPAM